jgi:G3E family GTPase
MEFSNHVSAELGFDRDSLQTTGLADPAPVVQTFFVDETIQEMYSLDSVITVVDAKEILDRLAEEKPEGVEVRMTLCVPTTGRDCQCAHQILPNKERISGAGLFRR